MGWRPSGAKGVETRGREGSGGVESQEREGRGEGLLCVTWREQPPLSAGERACALENARVCWRMSVCQRTCVCVRKGVCASPKVWTV